MNVQNMLLMFHSLMCSWRVHQALGTALMLGYLTEGGREGGREGGNKGGREGGGGGREKSYKRRGMHCATHTFCFSRFRHLCKIAFYTTCLKFDRGVLSHAFLKGSALLN